MSASHTARRSWRSSDTRSTALRQFEPTDDLLDLPQVAHPRRVRFERKPDPTRDLQGVPPEHERIGGSGRLLRPHVGEQAVPLLAERDQVGVGSACAISLLEPSSIGEPVVLGGVPLAGGVERASRAPAKRRLLGALETRDIEVLIALDRRHRTSTLRLASRSTEPEAFDMRPAPRSV